jgi:terpene synthase-like protein
MEGTMTYPLMIILPFPSRQHPAIEQTEGHARQWVVSHGLIGPGDPDLMTLPRLGRLAGFAYPDADPQALDLAADWVTWLYVFDDRYADQGRPDCAGLAADIAALLNVLDGEPPATPLAAGLHDLITRHRRLGTAERTARFAAHVRGYLLGVLAEVAYRAAGRVPTLAQYLPLRLQASACLPCVGLIEICGPAAAQGDETYDPRATALDRLAGYVIALANDVYSCPREIASAPVPFVFNLPLVLAANEGVTLPEAMRRAAAITQSYADDFTRQYEQARATGPALAAHAAAVAAWVQGTFDWLGRCGRYDGYQASQPELALAVAP